MVSPLGGEWAGFKGPVHAPVMHRAVHVSNWVPWAFAPAASSR
ncbi:hypothetical protein [Polaromonas sp. CG9_12]|nr:hypothetical protein [Polaromonas sp. CG9_12]